jgi:hypothetical protein
VLGPFRDDLISHTEYKDHIKKAKDLAQEKIYWSETKPKLEIAATGDNLWPS